MKKIFFWILILLITSCQQNKTKNNEQALQQDCTCELLETKNCNEKYKMYKMAVKRANHSKDTVWILQSSEANAKSECENFCPTKDGECKIGKQFHNEGSDNTYFDEKFWKDYEKKFALSDLPTYESFDNEYPKSKDGGCKDPAKVFQDIGGELLNPNFKNACATRVSRALNYSGINIPYLVKPNGDKLTFKGGDGKYYFVGARPLFEWLKKEFGNPDFSLNASQVQSNGSGFKAAVEGKKGIYVMIPSYPGSNHFGASGHTENFDGECNCNCYFDPKGGLHSANLWVLKESVQL